MIKKGYSALCEYRRLAADRMKEYIDSHPKFRRFISLLLKEFPSGAALYLVGGMVRDIIQGRGEGADPDLMCAGISFEQLGIALNNLASSRRDIKKVMPVGKHFPVYKVTVSWNKTPLDIALARTEVSTGAGHCDFSINVESVLAAQDSARRDFTFNAIFYRFYLKKYGVVGKIVDYQNGLFDLRERRIRAVGVAKERFIEDPLRMLRAVRQKNQHSGMAIEPNTLSAIQKLAPELLHTVSPERVIVEFMKALNAAPSSSIIDFTEANLLQVIFPELFLSKDSIPRLLKKYAMLPFKSDELLLTLLLSEITGGELIECSERVIERALLPNVHNLLSILNGFETLKKYPNFPYPQAQIEALLSKNGLKREILALYRLDRTISREPIVDFEAIFKKSSRISPSFSGNILMQHGIRPGKHMKELLLAVREKELSGFGEFSELLQFVLNLYEQIKEV